MTKRYWLRGGITLLIVYVLLFPILWWCFSIYGLPLLQDNKCSPLGGLMLINYVTYPNGIVQVLLPAIAYFIIGSIIGLIYGKIKQKSR